MAGIEKETNNKRMATKASSSPNTRTISIPTSLINRSDLVESPCAHDVICGRGGASNHHVGNIVYRKVVSHNKKWYVLCKKHHKVLLSKSIVEAIVRQDPPGRFLAKEPKTGKWYNIGHKKAVRKTSQALREGAMEVRLQNKRLLQGNEKKTGNSDKVGGEESSEELYVMAKMKKKKERIGPLEDIPPTRLDRIIGMKLAALLRKEAPKNSIQRTAREKPAKKKDNQVGKKTTSTSPSAGQEQKTSQAKKAC